MEERLLYNIADACRLASIGRTALYAAIGSGQLRALKRGRRALIPAADLKVWVESLPELKPSIAPPGQRDG
jgi:excisionase family DNA binding protein